MDADALYQSRLRSAEEAVAMIPSGSRLSMGMATSEPPALLDALARRADAGDVGQLRIYYYESMKHAAETVLRYELHERIVPCCMFMTRHERALIKRGAEDGGRKVVYYVPSTFHQAPRLLSEYIGVDTFLVTVSPMDRHGYFTLGTGNDYSSRVARTARRLLVEVNRHMPRVAGTGAAIHVSEVDAVVEHDEPLLELPSRAVSAEDEAVAKLIAAEVEDGACLQMGVGGLPNLVCANLADRKHLGVHSEVLCQGMVDLMQAGVIDNRRKTLDPDKTVYTFAMGDKAMYDFLDDNPAIESRPVDYVNRPEVIARNDRVVSINATLQVDLTGACNSEHMLGHQYSASGGQLDFVRGAFGSTGGKSIIACRSTAAKGTLSRIVARLDGPVTTPRTDTQMVVTEHGAIDLKGKSSAERAHALIALAHPAFRDDLLHAAKEQHLV